MKVLHLVSSAGQYGAENMLLGLVAALGALECESVIGVFANQHKPNLALLRAAETLGLPAAGIECAGRWDRKAIAQIRLLLDRHESNVVHSHGYKSNLYGYWAARQARIPIVATCHGWPGTTPLLRSYYRLDKFLLRRFDQVVAVSDEIKDTLRRGGVASEKLQRIDNGIDIEKFSGRPRPAWGNGQERDRAIRIGFVGRLAPEKGLTYILRAAKEIVGEFPLAEFHLVGDGPDRQALESLTDALHIRDKVSFHEYCTEMPAVYSEMDLFVLPSTSEGMPLALLEAMAAGKPVVVSRVGAIPQVVVHEQTGLLVEPADVDGLREALRRYLCDPEFASRMGENGARAVKCRYSSTSMAQRYLAVYRTLNGTSKAPTVSCAKPGSKASGR